MRCSAIKSKIDAYLDGELSPGTKNKIELHIAECKECREYLEITRELMESASTLHVPESEPDWEHISAGFKDIALNKALHESKNPRNMVKELGKFFSAGKLIPALSAVSAVVIFSVFVSLFFFLTSSSNLIASENDRFILKQVEAAEVIFEANISSLKQDVSAIKKSLPADIAKVINKADTDIENEIVKCSRLVQLYPSDRLIVEKLFQSYKMQIKLYKDLIKNIQSQEA